MTKPLEDLQRDVFIHSQETMAKEVATELFEKQVALTKRAAEIASEMLDQADTLGADGDPYKKQVARLVKGSVIESLAAMQQVATRRLPVEEAKEALQGDPFSVSSPPSASSLPDGPAPPKALPPAPAPDAQDQKRPRGRPRKNPPR